MGVKKRRVSVGMSQELYESLKAMATDEHRSMSGQMLYMVEYMLEIYLADREDETINSNHTAIGYDELGGDQ